MISEKCFGKMKINAKKMKMKICNFFNITSLGLVLVDLKTVSLVNEYIISVEI